jgi:hypothetical protein
MFGQKRPQGASGGEAATGKIRLPKSEVRPTGAELLAIKQKANENRMREIELMWTEHGSGKTYCLLVKWNAGPVEPTWTLLCDDGGGTHTVCHYSTIEHELINDVVCMLDRQTGVGIDANAAAAAVQADAAKKQQVAYDASQANQQGGGFAGPAPAQAPPQQGFSGGAPQQQGFSGGGAAPQQQQGYAGGAPQQQGYSGQGYGAAPSAPDRTPPPTGFGGVARPALPPDPRGFSTVQPSGFAPPAGGRIEQEPYGAVARPAADVGGTLEEMPAAKVIMEAAANRVTGKLEIVGEETVGEIDYVNGVPQHAASASAYGDGAIRELVTWEKGTYAFFVDQKTDMRSCEARLEQTINEGLTMLDQKRHLKRAGLTFDSWLIRMHKNLSDSELKLMLT